MFYFNTITDIPHNVIPELELGDSVTTTHAQKTRVRILVDIFQNKMLM